LNGGYEFRSEQSDFAIPSNDDATKSIAIIVNYIAAAIAEGLTERQAAKDDDTVEDITSDENEKKAARIQAEAESEAARGRGGVDKTARTPGAPKRRVPNSGRRTGAR
jgi:small subunit ribosomal protein S2